MFSPLVRHSFSKLQAREARREALDQRMSDEQVLKAREVVVLCLHPTGLFRPFYSESLLHEHGSAVFLFFFLMRSLSNILLLNCCCIRFEKNMSPLWVFRKKTRDPRCNLHHPSLSTICIYGASPALP